MKSNLDLGPATALVNAVRKPTDPDYVLMVSDAIKLHYKDDTEVNNFLSKHEVMASLTKIPLVQRTVLNGVFAKMLFSVAGTTSINISYIIGFLSDDGCDKIWISNLNKVVIPFMCQNKINFKDY